MTAPTPDPAQPGELQVPVVVEPESLATFRAALEQAAYDATRSGMARARRMALVDERVEQRAPSPAAVDHAAAADRRGAFAYQAFMRSSDVRDFVTWESLNAGERDAWIAAGNAAAASG